MHICLYMHICIWYFQLNYFLVYIYIVLYVVSLFFLYVIHRIYSYIYIYGMCRILYDISTDTFSGHERQQLGQQGSPPGAQGGHRDLGLEAFQGAWSNFKGS